MLPDLLWFDGDEAGTKTSPQTPVTVDAIARRDRGHVAPPAAGRGHGYGNGRVEDPLVVLGYRGFVVVPTAAKTR